MADNKLMYIVSYDEWVDEGNNYAGYSGFRNFQKIFLDVKDFTEWLDGKIGYYWYGHGRKFKINTIENSFYSAPLLLDMKVEVERSLQRIAEKRVEAEEKRLLAEKKKVEKKLEELKRLKTNT
jgi:hypothetical protein